MEGALLFYPADFALAAVLTNNYQVTHENNSDCSKHIRTIVSLPSWIEHAVLFFHCLKSKHVRFSLLHIMCNHASAPAAGQNYILSADKLDLGVANSRL